MSKVGIIAVSCVEFTKVVVSGVLLKKTTAPLRNPVPVTVRVKLGSPDLALFGDSEEIVGVGVEPLL